jgi:hypothetical protein
MGDCTGRKNTMVNTISVSRPFVESTCGVPEYTHSHFGLSSIFGHVDCAKAGVGACCRGIVLGSELNNPCPDRERVQRKHI